MINYVYVVMYYDETSYPSNQIYGVAVDEATAQYMIATGQLMPYTSDWHYEEKELIYPGSLDR